MDQAKPRSVARFVGVRKPMYVDYDQWVDFKITQEHDQYVEREISRMIDSEIALSFEEFIKEQLRKYTVLCA